MTDTDLLDDPVMRSKLFVPGSRPDFFAKALASDADAISIDLEDAVDESRKEEARQAVAAWLATGAPAASRKIVIVRVNGLASGHFEADLQALAGSGVHWINLPMAESAQDVKDATARLAAIEPAGSRPIGLLPNIESPRGLRQAAEIAGADARVVGLQLGFGDLLEPLGIDRRDAAAIHQLQLQVRLAAGEAGVWACDSAFAAVKDPDAYRAEAIAARRLGYLGKSCIHPSQIAIANEVFRPTDQQIAEALKVVQAADRAEQQGVGAYLVDGNMIDAPFVGRARAVVRRARRLGLI